MASYSSLTNYNNNYTGIGADAGIRSGSNPGYDNSYKSSLWGTTSSNSKGRIGASESVADVTTKGVTSETAANTQKSLNDYNTNREQKIRNMYSGSLGVAKAAQQTALDSNLANARNAYQQNKNTLQNTYEQNMSDAQYARDQISPRYQTARNELSAEYERQRRNNNMQAATNGLNTGAGSQMALAQSAAYQRNQADISGREQDALSEADKGMNDLTRNYNNQNAQMDMQYQNNITDLKTNYQNQIAQATANNDYQLAAALLDEYGAQYDRTMTQAAQLAEYGDFSMYANIYGQDAALQMEKNWSLQHPDLAYNLGKMTPDDYFAMTGKYPKGYTKSSTGGSNSYGSLMSDLGGSGAGFVGAGGGSSGILYSGGRSTGGGSSSGGYFGAPGYLNTAGEFVVPGAEWSQPSTLTAASGHEGDAQRAWRNINGTYNG